MYMYNISEVILYQTFDSDSHVLSTGQFFTYLSEILYHFKVAFLI